MPIMSRGPEARTPADAGEERSTEHWREHCQRILRALHPDYRAEGPFSARRVDVRRTLTNGLIVSHSYFVHRSREFHQGFALMWSSSAEKSPYALLRTGTRFFDRPLGEVLAMDGISRPPGLRDSQTWRSNSIPLLERSLEVAEEHLLPAYLALVDRGARRLARLFRVASDKLGGLPRRLPKTVEERARLLGLDPDLIEPYRSAAWVVTAADVLANREPYTDIPPAMRESAIIMGRLDDLANITPELPGIANTLGAL